MQRKKEREVEEVQLSAEGLTKNLRFESFSKVGVRLQPSTTTENSYVREVWNQRSSFGVFVFLTLLSLPLRSPPTPVRDPREDGGWSGRSRPFRPLTGLR